MYTPSYSTRRFSEVCFWWFQDKELDLLNADQEETFRQMKKIIDTLIREDERFNPGEIDISEAVTMAFNKTNFLLHSIKNQN